jgi:uncharacterized protein
VAYEPKQVFLSAEWRDLVMLNYAVDSSLLSRYLPPGTSLDSFGGKTYVSLVGFRFCRTKLLGRISVPFHSNFLEVNLRFYVRRQVGNESRRGVVFIAEVVPRRAIAITARWMYGENYSRCVMKHCVKHSGEQRTLEFHWRIRGKWCVISADIEGPPARPQAGTLEQFITEHYWGYSTGGRGCLEYHVAHVPWQVWTAKTASFAGDASALYGPEIGAVLQRPPDSSFVADGSPVTVFKGSRTA